jgi:exodeoxyribonuclease VII large subunit
VVGVGHESDVTLAEFAADLRAATPTAAAELISRPTQELLSQVNNLHVGLRRALRHRAQLLVQQVDRAELALLTPTAYLNALEARLTAAVARLPGQVARQLEAQAGILDRCQQALGQESASAVFQAEGRTRQAGGRLQAAQQHQLAGLESRLARWGAVMDAVSPQRTLERGYAFLQPAAGGQVIHSVSQLEPGDTVRATLADGEILVDVREKTGQRGPFTEEITISR